MKAATDLVFHELAGMFPLIPPGFELDQLAADIKKNGLVEPILLYEGKVADGRNRYNACKIAKVTPTVEDWDGTEEELITLIVSKNLRRRHLNESQRAMAAAGIEPRLKAAAKKRQALRANLPEVEKGKSVDKAAEMLNVSGRTVQSAKKVTEKADETVQQAVVNGEVSVSDAVKIVDLPKSEQKAAVKKVQAGKAKTLANAVNKSVAKKSKEKGGIGQLKDKARKAITAVCRCFDALGIYEEFKDVLQDLQDEVQKVRG